MKTKVLIFGKIGQAIELSKAIDSLYNNEIEIIICSEVFEQHSLPKNIPKQSTIELKPENIPRPNFSEILFTPIEILNDGVFIVPKANKIQKKKHYQNIQKRHKY